MNLTARLQRVNEGPVMAIGKRVFASETCYDVEECWEVPEHLYELHHRRIPGLEKQNLLCDFSDL